MLLLTYTCVLWIPFYSVDLSSHDESRVHRKLYEVASSACGTYSLLSVATFYTAIVPEQQRILAALSWNAQPEVGEIILAGDSSQWAAVVIATSADKIVLVTVDSPRTWTFSRFMNLASRLARHECLVYVRPGVKLQAGFFYDHLVGSRQLYVGSRPDSFALFKRFDWANVGGFNECIDDPSLALDYFAYRLAGAAVVPTESCTPRNNTSSKEENIPSFINFAEPISRWRELVIDPGLSEVQADLLYAVRNRTTSGLRFMVRNSGYGDDIAIENPTIPTFKVEKGSAWVILSRGFCNYVATSNQGRRVLMFFVNSPSSPEHFFQTMSTYASRNSAFKCVIIKDSLRAIVWHIDGKPNSYGQHPYELDNVTTFWPTLSASGALFARKFPERSPLLDKIDGLHETEVAQFLQRARQRLKRPEITCN